MRSRRNCDEFRFPIHLLSGDRLLFCFRPGTAHAVSQALGEDESIRWRAVIVFARADVPAGAIEMHMQRRRNFHLPNESRDAWEIWIGNAGAIITLLMRRVITHHGNRLVVI